MEAQKGLVIVGETVGAIGVVVLVVVGDKVVVLVPARKDHRVAGEEPAATPVGEAVLVVVVVDELIDLEFIGIVNDAGFLDGAEGGLVIGIDREDLAEAEVGVRDLGEIGHPGNRFLAADMVFFEIGVWIFAPAVVDVEFEVAVKALEVSQFEGKAGDLVGGGQPVVES